MVVGEEGHGERKVRERGKGQVASSEREEREGGMGLCTECWQIV